MLRHIVRFGYPTNIRFYLNLARLFYCRLSYDSYTADTLLFLILLYSCTTVDSYVRCHSRYYAPYCVGKYATVG
jgi:hypothetical protein